MDPVKTPPSFNLTYVLLAVLVLMLARDLWVRSTTIQNVPYSRFQTWLKEGKVKEVTVTSTQVRGVLREKVDGRELFVTTRVDSKMAEDLAQHGVTFDGQAESGLLPMLLSWVLPAVVFVGVWLILMKRFGKGSGLGGGLMSIGKSRAKVFVETEVKTRFTDVAGVDEARAELEEIVSFLKDSKGYGRLGARMPKGVLLVGPPGTGKTLLARAVAGEAGVPFFSISGSEFVEMFVGVGAARVRDLFEQARLKAPCIIFIDELDALGRARHASGPFGGHDEKEQTLNQLLVEMDGFDPTSGIVILAATNRPEILDAALLRAGRFDRQVLVDRPDRPGRIAILGVHLKSIPTLAPDVSPGEIAALTPGFTGADLANLVNEAALVATRRGAERIAMADFTAAIERIVAGLEKKNRLLNPKERAVVAHHEMGHALVAASIGGSDPVHKVSIIPRGIGALGYTIQRPTDDRFLMTREELEAKMCVLLGGRAAEHLVFQHLSTGAADDLVKVTDIARSMAMRYAMVPELGPVAYEVERGAFSASGFEPRTYSEETAREIDVAVRSIVERAFGRARRVLERNRGLLEESARILLERETLDEKALRELFAGLAGEAGPSAPAGTEPVTA